MKKLLFLAAAIIATVSCSQVEDTDVLAPSLKKEITITVSTDASASTRASVTPDENNSIWSVQWNQGDCLAAYSAASTDKLSMVEFSDPTGKCASFGGSVSDGDIRLVYPYSDITSSDYIVDLTSQTCDMKSSFSQLGANIPMVSPALISASDLTGDVAMAHIGSAVELQLRFSDLVEGTTYILESVAIADIPSTATVSLLEDIDSESFYSSTTSNGIAIDITNSPELENDVVYSVNCAALPFTTSAIDLTIDLYAIDAEGNRSTISITKSLSTATEVEFGRSLHHTIGAACSIDGATVTSYTTWRGDGSAADPYLISSVADLKAITDNMFTGKYFLVTNDINLNGSAENPWTPINGSTKFRGNFDGGGYTITGLYVNNSSLSHAGLFGWMGNGAIIENLSVEGYVYGSGNLGGIIGYNLSSTVRNCNFTGEIGSTTGTSGGIVGYCNTGASVDNCHFSGVVYTAGGETAVTVLGGVVGSSKSSSTISNCSSAGVVNGGGTIGGVVGLNHTSNVYNCYNTSNVICSADNSGGIVAVLNSAGIIANCYNVGDLDGFNTAGGIVGGTAGTIDAGAAVIDNCYNNSTIRVSGTNGGGCIASGSDLITGTSYTNKGCVAQGTDNDTFATALEADALAQLAATLNTAAAAYEGYELCGWVDGADSPMLVFGSDPASIVTTLSYWVDVASPNYGGGRGTVDSPYVISTPYELAHLAVEVAEGVDHSGVYFALSSNIDLSGRVWSAVLDFEGYLDYAGYTIHNGVVPTFVWTFS